MGFNSSICNLKAYGMTFGKTSKYCAYVVPEQKKPLQEIL
mgnify:CR=1 FL=1|tara:strand:+ start:4146 stop:4265 length:120 start_codon:yes stop_codon:yes gene_type:complete